MFFTATIGMAIRTFVRYCRLPWSSLGTGVPNERIITGPSPAEPCIPAQKNCGAVSPSDMMLNPWLLEKPQECGAANPWLAERKKLQNETPNV